MSMWVLVNVLLAIPFVLAFAGIPLWLVLRRPDTGPGTPAAPRPAHALAREATAHAARSARWQPAPGRLARQA